MKLKLDDMYTSGMVLQHGQEIWIRGTGENGMEVSASIQGQTSIAYIQDHAWTICFRPLNISLKETMVIASGGEVITLTDVLIGDVYLLAGQSNMEFRFKDCDTAADLQSCQNPYIRYYETPPIEYEDDSIQIPHTVSLGWQVCNAQTVPDFSAVGYYFAHYLQTKTSIPIGLIAAAKGGTSASCWMSELYLKRCSAIKKVYYDDYLIDIADQTDEQEDQRRLDFKNEFMAYMKKTEDYKKKHPEHSVSQMKQAIGHTPWPGPRGKKDFCRPAGLYRTMFRKVCGYRAKAVIWYQGEEDVQHADLYEQLLRLLIENWRQDMHCQIPFVVVQLPEYKDGLNDQLPMLRDAQKRACEKISDCHLVVSMNCGEEYNIHPPHKKALGKRVFQRIYECFYDSRCNGHSPFITDVVIGEKIKIQFDQELIALEPIFFTVDTSCKKKIMKVQVKDDYVLLDGCPDIKTISYGYVNYCKVHLLGKNGLPVSPFKIPVPHH